MMTHRALWSAFAVVLALAAGCGGDDADVASPTTAPAGGVVSTTVPAPTTTAATTTTTAPTTTVPTTTAAPADPCDPAPILQLGVDLVAAARLTPGPEWTEDTAGSAFAGHMTDPADFTAGLGLDCSLLVVSEPGGDHERLLLAAWTGDRRGAALLAVDGPEEPYEEAVRVDLLFEAPWGEWVTDDVWAVTVATGDSVILHVADYPLGPVAKSFLVAFPEPSEAPPETSAEAYGIAVLEAADARNVGLAEPSHGGAVAAIGFVTPQGNPMIATVGPLDAFDPMAGYLTGESTVHDVAGIEVVLTLPGPDQYTVGEAAFACDPWGWRLESGFGEPVELVEFSEAIIAAAGC